MTYHFTHLFIGSYSEVKAACYWAETDVEIYEFV